MNASAYSRPLNFFWALGLPLAVMILLLSVEPTRLDFALADAFYDPGTGFIGRHSAFLEDVLHDRAKQLVILIGIIAIAGSILSFFWTPLKPWRKSLGYLVLAMGMCTALVMPLKKLTDVPCPWSLVQYGGDQVYSPLLSERPATNKNNLCWPGGHASSGFTLFAFYFFLRDRRARLARGALAAAFALGCIFSIGRMMQGAHFLSHNIWTALFDWLVCLAFYRLMLYRPASSPEKTAPAPSAL
ncbi:phosphatase PAP2 family protein [Pseudomonas luteola]|uniref:phosphatase PAP2 family protein n=1 Tax=Pseudomonas luteola TaxID=47886 RepID=UPI001EF5A2D9|nr:phosphatase PAP2 family protein [Pseudomonas luteola]MCG7372169.1 phosphatase PAP2 family protein [Pseudomonas luteola]